MLLASAMPDSTVTPATYGVVVIVLLQLAQFVFAWRKDQRNSEAVKRQDLEKLRAEFRREISETEQDVEDFRKSMERKLEEMSKDSNRSRGELHEKINDVMKDTAKLLARQELFEQTLGSLGTKMDNLRDRLPSRS